MCVRIVNKPITNPNRVFSGVTQYNWWTELVKYPEHCTLGVEKWFTDLHTPQIKTNYWIYDRIE
jgi:hypothetical protein